MAFEILDVFKKKRRWPFCRNDPSYVKEKRPLSFTFKPVLAAKRVLFGYARQRKWLAWKSSKKHIVIRNLAVDMPIRFFVTDFWFVREGYRTDILVEFMALRITVVVCLVGSDGMGIPLGGENAFAANRLKSLTNATYASEQIYERK